MPPLSRVLIVPVGEPAVAEERVRALIDRLRRDGVAADFWEEGSGPADFTLVVGTTPPPSGLPGELVFLIFQGMSERSIPDRYRSTPWFQVETSGGYQDLLSYLSRPNLMKGGLSSRPEEAEFGGDISSPGGGEEAMVELSEESTPDPPRSAYARFDAPEVAVVGEAVEVAVGLAEKPTPGVLGGPMVRPEGSFGSYVLTVQLVAEGFTLRTGETWRRELLVTAEAPWPAAVFHLTPEPQEQEVRARSLQAFYSVSGQTMGMAFRSIAVTRSAEEPGEIPELPGTPNVDLAIPTGPSAPDLEVRILVDPDHDGRLLWTFTSPHAGLDLPDEPLRTDIGGDPKGFARHLVDGVNAREGKVGIFNLLRGLGTEISQAMPDAFWPLLRGAAASAEGAPDVLILSAEPYVPWELALMEEPLLDAAAPPFLAAQANVGRWVLPRQDRAASSRQRPRQPPPTEVGVAAMAVVTGVYNRPGWNRLKEAEEEGKELELRFKAEPVLAASLQVFECLAGTPAADLLHFAVHGTYDPGGLQDGLMLVDGETLEPTQVQGERLDRSPFVFLNACQVGSGSKILGDYSGMAAAFLMAGASGVVAPLWSVKDTTARQIALAFYEKTAEGMSPAAALREARAAFQSNSGPQSATCLAYQFFGHPAVKLRFSIP
jgi:hypothetical protein